MDIHDTTASLAKLVMDLGKVERATFHPDGKTRESVTTHTLMLTLMALAHFEEGMDAMRVMNFALVHDLAEAICGDTVTARPLDADARAAKVERESAAADQIAEWYPELAGIIDLYEMQDTPEARFVHALDKMLPSLSHSLNGGIALSRLGISPDELVTLHADQYAEIHGDEPEFPRLAALYFVTAKRAEVAYREAVRKAAVKITAAYFTGVPIGRTAGHYCSHSEGPRSPWAESSMRGYPLLDWHPERDGDKAPRGRDRSRRRVEKQGEFTHLQVDGWILLAAWDRSADKRGGCSVSFAFNALLTPAEALSETKKRWPRIIARIEAHIGRPVTLKAQD